MIDVAHEQLLTMEEAAERSRVTRQSVIKWWRVGSNGRKLETVKMGGARRTSVEALARFAQHPEQETELHYPTDSAREAQAFIESLKARKKRRDKNGNAKVERTGQAAAELPAR